MFDQVIFGNNELEVSLLHFTDLSFVDLSLQNLHGIFWVGQTLLIDNIQSLLLEDCTIDNLQFGRMKIQSMKLMKCSFQQISINEIYSLSIESSRIETISIDSVEEAVLVKVNGSSYSIKNSNSFDLRGCNINSLIIENVKSIKMIHSKFGYSSINGIVKK